LALNGSTCKPYELIGRRLKNARLERGLSIDQLETKTSISADELTSLEAGYKRPSAEQLIKLAACLGILLSDLFCVDEGF
jgi:transcriptional regulator with XRE-family HTH domain